MQHTGCNTSRIDFGASDITNCTKSSLWKQNVSRTSIHSFISGSYLISLIAGRRHQTPPFHPQVPSEIDENDLCSPKNATPSTKSSPILLYQSNVSSSRMFLFFCCVIGSREWPSDAQSQCGSLCSITLAQKATLETPCIHGLLLRRSTLVLRSQKIK